MEIKDGRYIVFAFTLDKGSVGAATFPMIVKNGIAKAVIEWGTKTDGTEEPAFYKILDLKKIKESATKEQFDYVYEGQIPLDWPLPPHSNN